MNSINLLYSLAQQQVPGSQGPFSLEASAKRCTRCNACAQSCPAYLRYREELFSPRGRAQFIRLLTEQKIKLQDSLPLLKKITQSCLLCARCSAACAGQIPIAHFMLHLRRILPHKQLPKLLHTFLHLYGTHPQFFICIWYTFQALRKTTFFTVLNYSIIRKIPFLRWLTHANDILPHKSGNLKKTLQKESPRLAEQKPNLLYFPSLEAQYVDESLGIQTFKILSSHHRVKIMFQQPSGFFEYIYGSQALALHQARRLLVNWEKVNDKAPIDLVTDSLDIYMFLKNYPFLFSQFPVWQKRAEKFSARVHFITDYIHPTRTGTDKAALMACGVLYSAKHITEQAYQILKTHFGKNLLECEYSRFPVPSAAEAFRQLQVTEEMALENVKDLARHQIKQVYCLSFWSVLELQASLRRNYPAAQTHHIVHIQGEL